MNKPVVLAAVVAAIALSAFVLNPSAERHREVVKAKIAERSPIAGMLGLRALAAFASTYRDWGLASTTEVNGRRLSFGVLGVVYVMQSGSDDTR